MIELQLSRVQQIWLMAALLSACIPIWYFLPYWVAAVAITAIAWRGYLLYRGHAQPGHWVMTLLALLLAVGILAQYRPPIGVEPMSSILTVAAALKFLEMSRRNESQLLIYLCLFISAIQPIFAQSIGSFLLALISITVILTAQSSLQRSSAQQFSLFNFSWEPLRQIFRLVAVSVPLTLIIFVIAPRMPAFRVLPVQIEKATTGISDFMDPGSISSLGNSSEVAFRVKFDGPVPAPRDLYWRGLVFSQFDGRSWSPANERRGLKDGAAILWSGRNPDFDWRNEIVEEGEPLRYSVYLEPTQEDWLFALPAATSTKETVGATRSLLLINRVPVAQPLKYDVVTYLNYRLQPDRLSPSQLGENTDFPVGANPRTEALVAKWLATNDGGEENIAPLVISELLTEFNRNFVYTFEPPAYPANALDQFLFEGRRGFCEHFASAAAAVLRMAGIPARIVAGYQGGEVHPTEGYLIVHQYNAHAWVEYWQPGYGWTRLDPTSAIAPERIERGFEEFFRNDALLDESLFSLARFRNLPLANWLRLQLDSLNYRWLSLVLGYDTARQYDFLQKLMGKVTPLRLALFLIVVMTTLLGLYLFWKTMYLRGRLSAEQRLLRLYLYRLQKLGVAVKPGMTLQLILTDAVQKLPDYQSQLVDLTRRLEYMLYRSEETDINQLEKDVKNLHPA